MWEGKAEGRRELAESAEGAERGREKDSHAKARSHEGRKNLTTKYTKYTNFLSVLNEKIILFFVFLAKPGDLGERIFLSRAVSPKPSKAGSASRPHLD